MLIAKHIVNMHRLKDDRSNQKFTKEQLQTYIKITRQLRP
jgi:DNA replicative helicase MCM subunit Mcm2 (Cdc46/Mcm family)